MEAQMIDLSKTVLGVELGSTRIKAVLIDRDFKPVAAGEYSWENRLINGIWTYSLDDAAAGLQASVAELKADLKRRFNTELTTVGAIGISAMMHGYLPFDENGRLLTPFRTWRNTMTGQAAQLLTEAFSFNIPQRWSVAHLYQAMLNNEEHVKDTARLTTLAGHIHYLLTEKHVAGIGEASGMFPIDSETLDYNDKMLDIFEELEAPCRPLKSLRDLLPKVICAGDDGGTLTKEGALLLDPEGLLLPGCPVAPCEGDAGTGMTATNSVREYTGNVSAGTSDFAMIVTDHPLGVHREIDMVTTPAGKAVAMVHCNNCTSDINAWAGLFSEFAEAAGFKIDRGDLFTLLFKAALNGEADCGGLLSYNYYSGEGVTDMDEGRPLFVRRPAAAFNLANFMRMHLLSALSTLKIGLDILRDTEQVRIDRLFGHGGFFKTEAVGQLMLSSAVGAPVSVMETAGEGGAYGMALLGAYLLWRGENETLEDFLDNKVFKDASAVTLTAKPEDIAGFSAFLEAYKKALPLERMASELF